MLPALSIRHLISRNKEMNWPSSGSGPLGSGPTGPRFGENEQKENRKVL